MINLGVVIAVSEYTADAGSLPACRQDGAAITHVLRSSGRFEEILHIDHDTTAPIVKQRLADFAKKYSSQEVGEFVFYFTGHGEFAGDEFYYLLTDYQSKRRKQTSLENSELDGLVRALSPELFVKIVDACHSGVAYIKSADEFQEFLKSGNKNFKKIYFMFSSQSEQFSYQNDKISYFTESIIKSIAEHGSETIRYKDVISFVSDDFDARSVQTPLFVTQADFTEILCHVTPQLKSELSAYLQESDDISEGRADSAEGKTISLADRLRESAKSFCTKEEAIAVVSELPAAVSTYKLSKELGEIFSISVEVETGEPPAPAAVGNWLAGSKHDKSLFAKPRRDWENYRKRVPKNPYKLALSSLFDQSEENYTYVDATREVVVGFTHTTDMPYGYIRLRLSPTLPNVAPEECYIVPMVSRTHLRLFWAFSHFDYVDWDRAQRVGKLEWTTADAPLKDGEAIQALVDQIKDGLSEFVTEPLKAKWEPDPPPSPPEVE